MVILTTRVFALALLDCRGKCRRRQPSL